MTLDEVYHQSLKRLKNPQLEEINIRMLLSDINGIESMSSFYIRKDEEIQDLQRFNELFERFLKGEPIQYLLKKAQFYGRDFYVDNRVLIPRMESEEVVLFAINKAKAIFGRHFKPNIADVCAGSGCLGITLSKELNAKELYLSDISKDAIDVTKKNLEIHNVDGHVFIGDSLEPLIKNNVKCDILISNPPYILKKEDVDKSVLDFEPHNALFTDENLYVYDHIISNLKKIMNKPSIVIFEIGYDLKPLLEEKIKKYLPDCEYLFSKDMNGNYRILSITLK